MRLYVRTLLISECRMNHSKKESHCFINLFHSLTVYVKCSNMTFRQSIWLSPNRKFFFTTVKWILSVNPQSKLAAMLKHKPNKGLPFLHNTLQFIKFCNTNTIQWNHYLLRPDLPYTQIYRKTWFNVNPDLLHLKTFPQEIFLRPQSVNTWSSAN